MRRLAAIALGIMLAAPARADFIAPGFFSTGFIEAGFFEEDAAGTVAVPNVVGEASAAAADAVLEGVGLDLGTDTARCSAAASGEVIGQSPPPGAEVALATLVNVDTSSGVACSGRPPLFLQLQPTELKP